MFRSRWWVCKRGRVMRIWFACQAQHRKQWRASCGDFLNMQRTEAVSDTKTDIALSRFGVSTWKCYLQKWRRQRSVVVLARSDRKLKHAHVNQKHHKLGLGDSLGIFSSVPKRSGLDSSRPLERALQTCLLCFL